MDIIQFSTGEKLPVYFPFDAMVDLMKDDGILNYLNKYTSIRHQIEVLATGLRYGAMKDGSKLELSDGEIKTLAEKNMRQVREVFALYDAEVAVYLKVYFSTEDVKEDAEELSEEEAAEQEEKVKP